MLGRNRERFRGRGFGADGANLLQQATAYLNGVAPFHWADFINNRMLYAGVDVGTVAGGTGYSFTRASEGTYRNANGTTTTFGTGVLRRGDRGVLIEGARTNLFLNSATGVTQSVTVTATAHTLSFEGTGTVTLSGASTAGPLVGTGALNRVSLTFTPSAGSLTLTITGTVERVNLEAGAFGSSWIPTAGSSVARAADVLTYTAGVSYPLTLWAEFERAVDTGVQEGLVRVDTSASANPKASLFVDSIDRLGFELSTDGAQAVAGSIAVGVVTKGAARYATNDLRGARGGTLSPQDATATEPTAPTRIVVGDSSHNNTLFMFGYIRRIAIINSAQNDAALQAMTT